MIAIPIDVLLALLFVIALTAFAAGCVAGWRRGKPVDEEPAPDAPQQVVAPEEAKAEEVAAPFVAAGRPRRPTWRQRRRELEAGARTKRQKLEEWRD